MTIVVKDGRFTSDNLRFTPLGEVTDLVSFSGNLDVPSDTDPAMLVPHLARLDALRIAFPSSSDGRGNSIARRLRDEGYIGLLRAVGHIHADQYPLALKSGFDEVEIDASIAQRQPEPLWLETVERVTLSYLDRLKKRAA